MWVCDLVLLFCLPSTCDGYSSQNDGDDHSDTSGLFLFFFPWRRDSAPANLILNPWFILNTMLMVRIDGPYTWFILGFGSMFVEPLRSALCTTNFRSLHLSAVHLLIPFLNFHPHWSHFLLVLLVTRPNICIYICWWNLLCLYYDVACQWSLPML